MDIRKLQRAIVDGLEDVKAQNIAVFNTEHLSPLFERVIIASGTSNRQTKALASSVREAVKSRGMDVLRTEGEDNGEWIIVDCGAAVAHIMQPAIRDYYHLEEIWGGKGVRMKMGDTKTSLVKASEPEPAKRGRPAQPARTSRRDELPPARQAAPRKTAPARKKAPAAAPAGVVKTIVVKPAAARKASAARGGTGSPARKTAGKTAARKAPARKTAARKA
jgi:ribosome-associated protein